MKPITLYDFHTKDAAGIEGIRDWTEDKIFRTVKKTDEGTYWDSSEFVIMTKDN